MSWAGRPVSVKAQSCCPLLSAPHVSVGTEPSEALFLHNHLLQPNPHPDTPEETRAASPWLLSQANQRAANSWQMLLETQLITHQEGCPAEKVVLTLFSVVSVTPLLQNSCVLGAESRQCQCGHAAIGADGDRQTDVGSQEQHLEQHQ